jgi:hypothetical protein
MRAEELTLKMLGLIPQDFDLRQSTVDLLTEQAAAFYDYNKKKLYVLEGTGRGVDDRMALVHELAHALADQHFRLAKYIHEGSRSDDGATARLAVMEGQASWLMTAFVAKESGNGPDVSETMLDLMSTGVAESADQYPVFSKAPRYIRETLVFPYTDGLRFQNAVYRKMGKAAISEVFIHPPESTQQILHPDRYLAHISPRVPDPPRLPNSRGFRTLADGSLGELDYRVLLTQYIGKDEGSAVPAHLAGSSYALFESKRGRYPVLTVASTWDSPQSAQVFFKLYPRVLKGKWKMLDIVSTKDTSIEGRGDSGYFRTWVDGATVRHIEGWKSPLH